METDPKIILSLDIIYHKEWLADHRHFKKDINHKRKYRAIEMQCQRLIIRQKEQTKRLVKTGFWNPEQRRLELIKKLTDATPHHYRNPSLSHSDAGH